MWAATWHQPPNIQTKYVDFPDHKDLRLELPRFSCHSLDNVLENSLGGWAGAANALYQENQDLTVN